MMWAKTRDAVSKGDYSNSPFSKDEKFLAMSDQEKKTYAQSWLQRMEPGVKSQLGDAYIAPGQSRPVGAPPMAPDVTDQALQKARTSFYLRTQLGKNQKSSFATSGTLGGFDVGKPVLGGY